MRPRSPLLVRSFLPLLLLSCGSALAQHEAAPPARHEIYAGYSFLSNSFNGVPGARQPLNGWDASLALSPWHGLRFKAESFGYRGTNLGAPQNPLFILGGAQYERRFGRETAFVEGLAGDVTINRDWGADKSRGETASFATLLGGGLDTPLSTRFALRASAGFIYENIALQAASPVNTPYRIPGLPNFFARITTGLVWRF